MNYTANYRLPQWVEDDRILMEDFNQAMETIDAGLHSKASGETVTALAESVDSQLEAIAEQIAACGNCQITTGSYIGQGRIGKASSNTLTFSFKPIMLLVYTSAYSSYLLLMRGKTVGVFETTTNTVTWGDNSVSWYNDADVAGQLNTYNTTYSYLCIGM